MSLPLSSARASSASLSLSNSMKAKAPYGRRGQVKEKRREGGGRVAKLAKSRQHWLPKEEGGRRWYLLVDVTLAKFLEFVLQVGFANVPGNVADEQAHF